jgi:hypothetical protein
MRVLLFRVRLASWLFCRVYVLGGSMRQCGDVWQCECVVNVWDCGNAGMVFTTGCGRA